MAEAVLQSQLLLSSHGKQGMFPRTGRKQMSLQPSKEGQEEDQGSDRLVDTTLSIGKMRGYIFPETISKTHCGFKKKKRGLGVTSINSQRRNCQICVAFYNEITSSVKKGKAVDTACHDFSKASDTVSHNILIWKMMSYSLDIGSVVDRALAELPASASSYQRLSTSVLVMGQNTVHYL